MMNIPIDHTFDTSRGLTICVLQVDTPLGKTLFRTIDEYNNRFSWSTESAASQNKKIKAMLRALTKIDRSRPIDILLLPEYIVPWNARDLMLESARELKCLIVFNYYSTSNRRVISELVFNGMHHIIPKLSVSVYENDYIEVRSDMTHSLFTISDTEGKVYRISVLSCLDFIKYYSSCMADDIPTLFLVPMASPSMDQFYSSATSAISHSPANGSNIVCLANNVGTLAISNKKSIRFIGSSTIVAPHLDRSSFPRLDNIHEGCILATLHPDRKVIQPTPTNLGIGCISNQVLMQYQIDRFVHLESFQPSNSYSINPQYIKHSPKINNYYSLCRIRNPIENIRYLREKVRTGLAIFSVYGYHDILVQSLERNPELFDLRFEVEVEYTLKPHQVESKEVYEVVDVYKYRGTPLKNYIGDETSGILRKNSTTLVFIDLSDPGDFPRGLFEGKAPAIRDILLGKMTGNEDEYCKARIFLPSSGSSDLTEDEISQNLFEILVYVFLIPSEGDFDVYRIFEDSVIRVLMSNHNIRSIERVKPVATESSQTQTLSHLSYVLHYAGQLSHIDREVYSVMASQLRKYGIDYATRTVIIHETLSNQKYDSFIESDFPASIKDIVANMILNNCENDTPLLFLRIEPTLLEEIAHYYHSHVIYAKAKHQGRSFKSYINDLSNYVYCIARIHAFPDEKDTLEDLMTLLEPHYAPILNKQFERIVNIFVERIQKHSLYLEHMDYLVNEKKVRFSNLEHLSLNDKIQLVIVWHKYIECDRLGVESHECNTIMAGDEHCTQEKAIEYLQFLQKKKANIFRNWFSHPPEPPETDLSRATAIRGQAYDMFQVAVTINKLLMRCMYKVRYSSRSTRKHEKPQQHAARAK